MKKRLIAMLMVLVLCAALLPVTAFAGSGGAARMPGASPRPTGGGAGRDRRDAGIASCMRKRNVLFPAGRRSPGRPAAASSAGQPALRRR